LTTTPPGDDVAGIFCREALGKCRRRNKTPAASIGALAALNFIMAPADIAAWPGRQVTMKPHGS